jgi:hypothetical protein
LVKFLESADEWSNVAEIVPSFKDENRENENLHCETAYLSPLVSIDEVIQYLNSGVLESYLGEVSGRPTSTWQMFYSCICSSPRLSPDIENVKQSILATALIPFQNDQQIHLAMLRSLYRQLTGSKLDCPRYGHHWEDIGFQGNDPSTDLRGVGILGLVNALYLVINAETLPFAKQIYSLSLKESQEFPLMVLSLNVTRICLHILRDGLLDTRLFLDKDAWLSFNTLYASVMYHIYHIWKTQHKTISNCGFVLQDAEESARKSPERMMNEFSKYVQLTNSCSNTVINNSPKY